MPSRSKPRILYQSYVSSSTDKPESKTKLTQLILTEKYGVYELTLKREGLSIGIALVDPDANTPSRN